MTTPTAFREMLTRVIDDAEYNGIRDKSGIDDLIAHFQAEAFKAGMERAINADANR